LNLFAQEVVVGIHSNYSNDILKIGFNKPGYSSTLEVENCPALNDPKLLNIQRITMDILVICNAIKEFGTSKKIVFLSYPNVARGAVSILSGKADVIGQTLFVDDHKPISNNLLFTSPIIRSGEFEVGVFTTRNRLDILGLKTLEEFRKSTGTTVSSWETDKKMMRILGISKLNLVPNRGLIYKVIAAGRSDFTFSYLKEPIVTRIGGELIRIPGVKVSFPQERAFLVSPKHPHLYTALQRFIAKLRGITPDALRHAYIHAGFIAPEYKSWIDLTLE